MTLAMGTKIGPYEITASIGAGGMGEVYRARDSRLDRDVAIKILPASFAHDADRLKRFEQEARAVGALNHPNILAVYDIGRHEGAPYLVSELLEGEDLRRHMDGAALPQRKVIEYAIQIAQGLAAAHEKGVVHRDLKPDNIFILRDGRVKILDFGLAKLVRPEPESVATFSGPTIGVAAAPATTPGQVMGTVGYMSPEQVRGQQTDHRTDVFSYGAILYEMLTGQRAFKRDSSIETMTAILKEEPPEITETTRNVSPGLERIVRHCLEKAPERRFQSARDLAFDLETLSQGTGTTTRALVSARVQVNRWRWIAIGMAAIAGASLVFYAGRRTAPKEAGVYKQLTFQRGWIGKGRFSPDGESVTFSANWNGQGRRLYTGRSKALNWQSSTNEPMEIASISRDGDSLVLRNIRGIQGFASQSTLAMIPATGGSPKDLVDGVQDADYSPDGKTIAATRFVDGGYEVQAPLGKTLYRPQQGWVSDVRFAPDGKSIGFFEHPVLGDARGFACVITLDGKKKQLTPIYSNIMGIAWHPNAELWYSASESGLHQALFAVGMRGAPRIVERVPGNLTLLDISTSGKVLVVHDTMRRGLMGYNKQKKLEVDLAWFDWSNLRGISNDGQYVLIEEEGEGGGPDYTLFLRNINGDPPSRVGSGGGWAISPDMKWVLGSSVNDTRKFHLLPIGVGEPRDLPGNFERFASARFLNDSKHIVFPARGEDGRVRTYVQDIDGGEAKPITPEGFGGILLSPNERKHLANDADGHRYLFDLTTGEKRQIAWDKNDNQLRFATNDSVYVAHRNPDHPESVDIVRLDLNSGQRTPVFNLHSDATGLIFLGPVVITPDGSSYAYSVMRTFSDLYLVDGLK